MLYKIEQIFPHSTGNLGLVNNILFPLRLNNTFLKCASVFVAINFRSLYGFQYS